MGRRAEASISLQLHSFGHFSSLLARYSFQWREATLSFTWELVRPPLRWGTLMGERERVGMVWVWGLWSGGWGGVGCVSDPGVFGCMWLMRQITNYERTK